MQFAFSALTIGFLLGLRHATDADHVVAVTTIVSRENKIKNSSLVGILWGIGHSITVTSVAIPIIFFSFVIPQRLGLELEFLVGIMLVILGILNLSGITSKITQRFTPVVHEHSHQYDREKIHSHFHIHIFNKIYENIHHLGFYQSVRPVIVGLVHGLAGSAAIALLILTTIRNPKLAALYLFIFHLGVIGGMMLITTLIGASLSLATNKNKSLNKHATLLSGMISLVFGIYIMYQTGSKIY